jgi:hypothetical protein
MALARGMSTSEFDKLKERLAIQATKVIKRIVKRMGR